MSQSDVENIRATVEAYDGGDLNFRLDYFLAREEALEAAGLSE